jgi:hypothetical protein
MKRETKKEESQDSSPSLLKRKSAAQEAVLVAIRARPFLAKYISRFSFYLCFCRLCCLFFPFSLSFVSDSEGVGGLCF